MSSYDQLKNKGLAQGSLSHEEIRAVMQNEIMSPPDFMALIEKLESAGILIYKGAQSQRLEKLIKKGKSKGFLQRIEVVSSLPSEVDDEEQINDIIQMIEDMGIKVEL